MPRKTALFAAALALLATVAAVRAQKGFRFRRRCRSARQADRSAQVGPVRFPQVQFSVGGGGVKDSIPARVKGGGATATPTVLRAGPDSENAKDQGRGHLHLGSSTPTASSSTAPAAARLRRGRRGEVEHLILTYVVPMIAR
jgi:hypothetical protein